MMAALVKSRCTTDSGHKAAARDWLLSAWSSRWLLGKADTQRRNLAGAAGFRWNDQLGCSFTPGLPGCQKEHSQSASQIDRKFGVPRSRFDADLASAMRIAKAIAKRAQPLHHRRASAQDLLENLLSVLSRGNVELFGGLLI